MVDPATAKLLRDRYWIEAMGWTVVENNASVGERGISDDR